jgi:hypothetical protein
MSKQSAPSSPFQTFYHDNLSLVECDLTGNYINVVYLKKLVYFAGLIFNFLNIITLYLITRREQTNGHMFKYFLVKSVNDFVYFCISVIDIAYYCGDCESSTTYIINIWYIWLYWYFEAVLLNNSGLLEVLATLDCYFSITKKCQFFNKQLTFYTIMSLFFILNLCINIYRLFNYKIVETNDILLNSTDYHIHNTPFHFSDLQKVLEMINVCIRDLIPLLLMIIINSLILLEMKKLSKRKAKLTIQQRNRINKIRAAEQNKIKMIFITGLNYVILHTPLMIYYLSYDDSRNKVIWACFSDISWTIYEISLFSSFFIYFLYNKTFKKYFLLLTKLDKCFLK